MARYFIIEFTDIMARSYESAGVQTLFQGLSRVCSNSSSDFVLRRVLYTVLVSGLLPSLLYQLLCTVYVGLRLKLYQQPVFPTSTVSPHTTT